MASNTRNDAGNIQLYNIYCNIIKMVKSRGFTLDKPEETPSTFAQLFFAFEYITVSATNKNNTIIVILPFPGRRYNKIDADTRELINTFINTKPTELIFITDIDFTAEITASVYNKIHDIIASGLPDTIVQIRSYDNFRMDISSCKLVFKHEIMDQAECMREIKFSHLNETAIPLIKEYDTPVVWIGGKPGDYIRIIRMSPITGEAIVYRRVVPI